MQIDLYKVSVMNDLNPPTSHKKWSIDQMTDATFSNCYQGKVLPL